MSNQEIRQQIIEIMKEFRGRMNGTSNQYLAERLGVSKAEFREIYSDIVCDQQAFLGTHPDFGFFMIVDDGDFKISVGHIESRLIKLAKRRRALDEMKEKRQTMTFEEGSIRLKESRAAVAALTGIEI